MPTGIPFKKGNAETETQSLRVKMKIRKGSEQLKII